MTRIPRTGWVASRTALDSRTILYYSSSDFLRDSGNSDCYDIVILSGIVFFPIAISPLTSGNNMAVPHPSGQDKPLSIVWVS